jgi:hypothetical protein
MQSKVTLKGAQFMRGFRRRIQRAAKELGEQEASALRADLSIPVVHRKGMLPLRSLPGEAPRKDEGKLRASVNSDIFSGGDVVGVKVEAGGPSAPYAGTLERGGSTNFGMIAHRPFMYPSHERMKVRARTQLPRLLQGRAV